MRITTATDPDHGERRPRPEHRLPRDRRKLEQGQDDAGGDHEPGGDGALPVVERHRRERGDHDDAQGGGRELVARHGLCAEQGHGGDETDERRPPEEPEREPAGHGEDDQRGAVLAVPGGDSAAGEQFDEPAGGEDQREDDAGRERLEKVRAPWRRGSCARRRGEDVGWPFHARSIGEVGGPAGMTLEPSGRGAASLRGAQRPGLLSWCPPCLSSAAPRSRSRAGCRGLSVARRGR